MAEPLDKTALVRLALATALRRQGTRQCRNTQRDDYGSVCLMELLREVAGAPQSWSFTRVGQLAGLDEYQTLEGVCRNDGRCGFRPHTFAELADWLEGLPQ